MVVVRQGPIDRVRVLHCWVYIGGRGRDQSVPAITEQSTTKGEWATS
jgi:hypothetical protein